MASSSTDPNPAADIDAAAADELSAESQLSDSQADASRSSDSGSDAARLPRPEQTNPTRVLWEYVAVLGTVHLLSLLAFIPWLFTWSGLVLAIAGHFVFGMMGITIGYHRLLTHRGFTCPKWLEYTLAILGMCNLQDSPARWVAIHRIHHQHSDKQDDPHTPLVSFLWGHMGWVLVRNRDLDVPRHFERYVRDLLRDPFYLRLERKGTWFLIYVAHAIVFATAGALVGWTVGGSSEAIRYAASYFVWGVAVRTVFVLHGTWSVNSLAHVFGYRNYETRDVSKNNWLVALISHGEGWHNNHHAEPRAAAHGHRWWEYDMSWWIIRTWERMGLAKDVVRPKSMLKAKS